MALEIIETDAIGMTGSVRTRNGDKLNILLTENHERAMVMLIQNGELEGFKYIPNINEKGIPYRILEQWSFDDLYGLLWPNEAITEKRAMMIEGVFFFVQKIIDGAAAAMATQICDSCMEDEHSHSEQHNALTPSLH
ncbi:hypothetical protein [Rosenbergiella collisarenosi]|uniref:hypothetical protein n=1 Tax=Rosenbergiella collisarenosi TaxID=1544695 RepID=UPI001F4DD777|nr:hypothetical protein [Rosenbergiella collisarenosi]